MLYWLQYSVLLHSSAKYSGKNATRVMTLLPYLTIHRVSGADAGSFLHAQLAADTSALVDGQSCFAAYCSPRGQVIALLLVCRQDPAWFIVTEASLASQVATRLRMFVLRAKANIEALHEMQVAGLYAHEVDTAQAAVFTPGELSLRYALISSGTADGAALMRWRREEIVRGISWLQSATSERFLPQMLGLDAMGAVSFSKGCYPGQEIIARARYLGKLKRRPVLLELDGSPTLKPGESCVLISAGERIEGVVVDTACAVEENTTTVRVVAPLEADRPLNSLECNADRWPARRIDQAWATM